MGWIRSINGKAYKVLSLNTAGRDIIRRAPKMSQSQLETELDNYFNNKGWRRGERVETKSAPTVKPFKVNYEGRAVKSSIFDQKFPGGRYGRYESVENKIVGIGKETEKAVYAYFETKNTYTGDSGSIGSWMPKSLIYTAFETEEMNKKAVYKEEHKFDRYTGILNWCKENGIKGVRMKMKIDTMINKATVQGKPIPQNILFPTKN